MADIPETVWDLEVSLEVNAEVEKNASDAFALLGTSVEDTAEDLSVKDVEPQKTSNDVYPFITPGIDDYPVLNRLEEGFNPQKVTFSGFADLIMWDAIYDLSIPPVPIDGVMYPQFVRRVNQGGAQTAHLE